MASDFLELSGRAYLDHFRNDSITRSAKLPARIVAPFPSEIALLSRAREPFRADRR